MAFDAGEESFGAGLVGADDIAVARCFAYFDEVFCSWENEYVLVFVVGGYAFAGLAGDARMSYAPAPTKFGIACASAIAEGEAGL